MGCAIGGWQTCGFCCGSTSWWRRRERRQGGCRSDPWRHWAPLRRVRSELGHHKPSTTWGDHWRQGIGKGVKPLFDRIPQGRCSHPVVDQGEESLLDEELGVEYDQFGGGGDEVIAAVELEELHEDLLLVFLWGSPGLYFTGNLMSSWGEYNLVVESP